MSISLSIATVAYLFLALCGIYRIVTVSYCSSPRLDGGLHGLSRRDSRGWSGKTILAALNVVLATSPLAFVAWTLAQGEEQIPLTEVKTQNPQTLHMYFQCSKTASHSLHLHAQRKFCMLDISELD